MLIHTFHFNLSSLTCTCSSFVLSTKIIARTIQPLFVIEISHNFFRFAFARCFFLQKVFFFEKKISLLLFLDKSWHQGGNFTTIRIMISISFNLNGCYWLNFHWFYLYLQSAAKCIVESRKNERNLLVHCHYIIFESCKRCKKSMSWKNISEKKNKYIDTNWIRKIANLNKKKCIKIKKNKQCVRRESDDCRWMIIAEGPKSISRRIFCFQP